MTDTTRKPGGFVFTGKHMVFIMLAFFGVIITVNMIMAWQAVRTWSGLVVPNTYIASQQFNGKVAAQRALAASGIKGSLEVERGLVTLRLFHPQEGAVEADSISVRFLRPVGTEQDFTIELNRTAAGVYTALHDVKPGQWITEIKAGTGDRPVFHEAKRIFVIGDVQ